MNELDLIVLACIGMVVVSPFANAVTNALWQEGYEIEISGTVQIAQKEENRFWGYKYTHIEIQSFSGEDFDLDMVGHHTFDVGQKYRIVYTRVSPKGLHQLLMGEVVNIEVLGE